MDRSELKEWDDYRVAAQAFPEAAERGRLLAASRIAEDQEVRNRMEDRYGLDFCKAQYPEAYKSGFIARIGQIWKNIPWF